MRTLPPRWGREDSVVYAVYMASNKTVLVTGGAGFTPVPRRFASATGQVGSQV